MPGTTGFPGGSMVRNPPANAENSGDKGLILGLGSSPWRISWTEESGGVGLQSMGLQRVGQD